MRFVCFLIAANRTSLSFWRSMLESCVRSVCGVAICFLSGVMSCSPGLCGVCGIIFVLGIFS